MAPKWVLLLLLWLWFCCCCCGCCWLLVFITCWEQKQPDHPDSQTTNNKSNIRNHHNKHKLPKAPRPPKLSKTPRAHYQIGRHKSQSFRPVLSPKNLKSEKTRNPEWEIELDLKRRAGEASAASATSSSDETSKHGSMSCKTLRFGSEEDLYHFCCASLLSEKGSS